MPSILSGLALDATLASLLAKFPSNAASEITLADLLVKASSIDSKLTSQATAALQTSGNSILSNILSTLQGSVDLDTSVWTDDSGAYYVRRDIIDTDAGTVTVSWTNQLGAAATPGAGLRPLSSTNKIGSTTYFDATAAGTGYSIGDVLGRVTIADPGTSPPTIVAFWLNVTTNAVISTPTGGTYEDQNRGVFVQNQPSDFPDANSLAKLEAIRALVAATLTVQGQVSLDSATLAALENVSITNLPTDYPDSLSQQLLANLITAVRTLITYSSVPDTSARTRVNIETGTVTTVSTLSNITSIGGAPATSTVYDINQMAYANAVRSCIT